MGRESYVKISKLPDTSFHNRQQTHTVSDKSSHMLHNIKLFTITGARDSLSLSQWAKVINIGNNDAQLQFIYTVWVLKFSVQLLPSFYNDFLKLIAVNRTQPVLYIVRVIP